MAKAPPRSGTNAPRRRRKPGVRRSTGGLLDPGQSIVIPIDPPLRDFEQPVVITPNAGDVLLQDASLTHATVANQTDRIVAYAFTVAPRLLVKAATVPWGRVVRDLGQAVKNSGLLERFSRLIGR